MQLDDFRILRFQFRRDRVIGDSQVRAEEVHVATLELIDKRGESGLGFAQSLFTPLSDQLEIERVFREEIWPGLAEEEPLAMVHGVSRLRGGNQRATTLPFREAVQVALWDLAAKQVGLPLFRLLGARRDRVPAYASGLDFHLDDNAPSANSSATPTRSATAPSRSRWGIRMSSGTCIGSRSCARPFAGTRRSWSTPTRRGAPGKPR